MSDGIVLSVEELVTSFMTEHGRIVPVNGVSFDIERGKTLAIVGESGSGKSVTALSIMRLIPEQNGRIESGRILFEGADLLKRPASRFHQIRGNRIAMIFQEPMTALNPVHTVGRQIAEVFRLHQNLNRKAAWARAIEMLERVKMPDPEDRARSYPHQLSGGMRQRVMIAMALACDPAVLIADEPTTALDVTIQAQVLRLIDELQADLGTAVLFITHDLGVVAQVADDVAVMYTGKIVERGSVQAIFDAPRHPYTRGLMNSLPKLTDDRAQPLTAIRGMVPSLWDLPEGCTFADRCPEVEAQCRVSHPPLISIADGYQASCHLLESESSV